MPDRRRHASAASKLVRLLGNPSTMRFMSRVLGTTDLDVGVVTEDDGRGVVAARNCSCINASRGFPNRASALRQAPENMRPNTVWFAAVRTWRTSCGCKAAMFKRYARLSANVSNDVRGPASAVSLMMSTGFRANGEPTARHAATQPRSTSSTVPRCVAPTALQLSSTTS